MTQTPGICVHSTRTWPSLHFRSPPPRPWLPPSLFNLSSEVSACFPTNTATRVQLQVVYQPEYKVPSATLFSAWMCVTGRWYVAHSRLIESSSRKEKQFEAEASPTSTTFSHTLSFLSLTRTLSSQGTIMPGNSQNLFILVLGDPVPTNVDVLSSFLSFRHRRSQADRSSDRTTPAATAFEINWISDIKTAACRESIQVPSFALQCQSNMTCTT